MIRWIYAEIGVPMWAWTPADPSATEQAVMFYAPGGPFDPGFPPMTDAQWEELEKSNADRDRRC